MQPVLEQADFPGRLVSLRATACADAEPAFALLHQRRTILDWILWAGPGSVEELRAHYANWKAEGEDGSNYHFAIEERAQGRFCGAISLHFSGHPYCGEIGYWLGEEFWNRGWMSEAIGLVAGAAFDRLDSVLLYARVIQGNHASSRALAKNGFVANLVSRAEIRGKVRTLEHFSLTRTGFERRLAFNARG